MVAKRALAAVLVVMLLILMVPRPAVGGTFGGCADNDDGCNNTYIGIAIVVTLIVVGLVVYTLVKKHRQRSSAPSANRTPDPATASRLATTGGEEAPQRPAYAADGQDVQAP